MQGNLLFCVFCEISPIIWNSSLFVWFFKIVFCRFFFGGGGYKTEIKLAEKLEHLMFLTINTSNNADVKTSFTSFTDRSMVKFYRWTQK